MILFVIPLRGRSSASDWARVSACCERTLRSVCAQTDPRFRVILVCSDRPDLDFEHPNLEIIQGDFPTVTKGDRQQQMLDKIRKIERGLIRANTFCPDYIMKLDADDCISSNLVEFVNGNPPEWGYVIEDGWVFQEGRSWIVKTGEFSKFCGSCFVIRVREGDLPSAPSNGSLHPLVHVPHHELRARFDEAGKTLQPLPFPGAVYCADTGENWSEGGMFRLRSGRLLLKRLAMTRIVTPALKREFSLYPLRRS